MPEIAVVVTGAPGGERSARFAVDAEGEALRPVDASDGEPDLLLTLPHADAVAAGAGDYGVDVAFMRGSAKVVGSMGTFMDLLPVLQGEQWRAACRELAGS